MQTLHTRLLAARSLARRVFSRDASPVDAIIVRDAKQEDLDEIRRIYSHHVVNTFATSEKEPPDSEEMLARFLKTTGQGFPYLVVELDKKVVGYSYAGYFRSRAAYRTTVENSIYVGEGATGKGIGRILLQELIKRCEELGFRQMIAVIGHAENHASIVMHERCGFVEIARFHGVYSKFGQWVDTVFMQREIGDGSHTPPPEKMPPHVDQSKG